MKMLSLPHLLEQACTSEGLDITQTVDEFLHGLNLECYLCQQIYDFSEHYQHSKFSNSFYHLEPGKLLFKNVKCRKMDRLGNLGEIPMALHFDRMEIMLGSHDAAEDLMFDIQACDGKQSSSFLSRGSNIVFHRD